MFYYFLLLFYYLLLYGNEKMLCWWTIFWSHGTRLLIIIKNDWFLCQHKKKQQCRNNNGETSSPGDYSNRNLDTKELNSSWKRRWILCFPAGIRCNFEFLICLWMYSGWKPGTIESFTPWRMNVGAWILGKDFLQMSPSALRSLKLMKPSIHDDQRSWSLSLPYIAGGGTDSWY